MRGVAAIMLCLVALQVSAEDLITVRDIRVEGLQKISEGTVFNYLPVNIGDVLDQRRIAESIRAVYATGFFKHVEFRRDGDTLIVVVIERPSIENFSIEGNKDIETDQLMDSMRGVGLARGRTFNQSTLDEVEQFLTDQYFSRGKYGVIIDTTVTESEGNTVDISIKITEGDRARIRQINIVGNERFPEEEIIADFQLKTPNWLSFYKSDDRYDRESLQGDLEKLRSFYMDRGYANFQITSTQVAISPDRKDIFITLNVQEGEPYTINEIKVAGDTIVPEEELRRLILAKPGQTYSRKLLESSSEFITYRLGEDGYAFARVDPIPQLNEEDKTVDIVFFVDPGNRTYVRKVEFKGAESTNDEVFRREMRQQEGAWLSNSLLERSKVRLQRLPFIEKVDVETVPVPGTPDLVDLDFQIKEGLPGQFGGGLGYSGSQGVMLNGNFTHTNFMGSGNAISGQVNTGKYSKMLVFSHTNPYVNMDGISRSLSLGYRDTVQLVSNGSEFNSKTINLGVQYGYPITEWQRLSYGVNLRTTELITSSGSSQQLREWVINNGNSYVEQPSATQIIYGTDYNLVELTATWLYDTRNRAIFANRGSRHILSLAAAVPGSDVEYFAASFESTKLIPIWGQWGLAFHGEVNFTDALGDTLDAPPARNFFAGGPNTVRGYRESSLGPRDSNGRPYGGNLMVAGQAELLLPLPEKFATQARASLFFDIGNVFSTGNTRFFDYFGNQIFYKFDAAELRQSVGVSVQWLAPLGLFRFSYGIPLNKFDGDGFRRADETENFQFSIGSAF
jgi:outer membrane protein insertion porin family